MSNVNATATNGNAKRCSVMLVDDSIMRRRIER